MTLRLILTRHAKSSWDDPNQGDHDRPLNKRGRKSASAIGTWLAGHGYIPHQALVSSAERTRETWARIAQEFPAPPTPEIVSSLYLAEPEEMLAVLRAAAGKTVMLIAHNPGSAYLAEGLVSAPPSDVRFHHYPTAATTVIDFDAPEWQAVQWNSGRVVDFIVPRDLF